MKWIAATTVLVLLLGAAVYQIRKKNPGPSSLQKDWDQTDDWDESDGWDGSDEEENPVYEDGDQ